MQEKVTIQFSPTRLKQVKKIAFSGSKAKLKILKGKLTEGFHLLQNTAQKLKSFATDLSDRIPQALAAQVSLNLFSHFETKNSKRLGIPKGIVLGGVLTLLANLPTMGQTINAANTAQLVAAINTANGDIADGIIHLEQGATYTLGANLPTIVDKATGGKLQIICTGSANAIIDGNDIFRPLTMAVGSDLTISKLTIQNGKTIGVGGGIYNYQGDLTISNSLITNNEAARGGGVYSRGQGGSASVLIQNSTISLNSASSYGGGICNRINSLLTISNSYILENTTPNFHGGGIFNQDSDNLSISSSSISGNTSGNRGGGLYNLDSDNLSISSSSISGNKSNDGGGIYNRYSSNMTISNSSISENTSTNNGGGVFNRFATNLNISNSSISKNVSTSKGGGVYNRLSSNLTISSSSISENRSNDGGGVLLDNSKFAVIQASNITANQATNQGAGVFIYTNFLGGQSLHLQNTTISGNTATGNSGGAIFHNNGGGSTNTLTLQHVTLSNNSGIGTGGLANIGATNITLQNTIIANSTGTDFTLGGATINAVSTSNIVESGLVHGSVNAVDPMLNTLSGDVHSLQAGSPAIDAASVGAVTTHDQLGVLRTAPHDIGAVQFATSACVFDVTTNVDAGVGSLRQAILDANVNSDDCIIHLDGGETYTLASNLPTIVDKATGGTLQIISTGTTNAIIDGAGTHRPLTMTTGSNLTISKITIQNGKVTNGNGGGIYNNNGDLTISNSIITDNEVTHTSTSNGRGAGIFSTGNGGNASVLIQNSTISLNSASVMGGGISNQDNSTLTISSSSISENSTEIYGGGVFNTTNSSLTISSSSISENTTNTINSNSRGGGIFNSINSSLAISSSFISGNTVGGSGGGIFNQINSPLIISSSSIFGNTSTNDSGGGVFNHTNSPLTISSSSISGNASGKYGGGIYNTNSPLTISSSSVSGNMSNGFGGGICNRDNSFLTISNSSISGNTSGSIGGGLVNLGSNLNILASSIITNQATQGGGGIAIFGTGGNSTLLQNTTISRNTSTGGVGGGIYHGNSLGVNDITLQHVTLSDNTGNGAVGTGDGFHNKDASNITFQNTIIANSNGAGGKDFALSGAPPTSHINTGTIVADGSLVDVNVLNVDPLLGALTLNSGFLIHPVKTTSPAIDAGVNLFATIPTDQVGNPRDINPTIGATEVTTPGVCMVVSAPAGVTNTWIGCTNDDWNTASNWSSGTVPTANDVVYVPIAAQTPLVIDEIVTCAKMVVQIGAKCKVDYNAGGQLKIKF